MVVENIGDLKRNMEISKRLSNDMLEFAKANKRAKDSMIDVTTYFHSRFLQTGRTIQDFFADRMKDINDWMKTIQKWAAPKLKAGNVQAGGQPPNPWWEAIKGFGRKIMGIEEGKKPPEGPKWKPPQFGLNPDKEALGMVEDFQGRINAFEENRRKQFDPRFKLKGFQPQIPGRMLPPKRGPIGGPGAENLPDWPMWLGGGRKGVRPDNAGPGIGGFNPKDRFRFLPGGAAGDWVKHVDKMPEEMVKKVHEKVGALLKAQNEDIDKFVSMLPKNPKTGNPVLDAMTAPVYSKMIELRKKTLRQWDALNGRMRDFEKKPVVGRNRPNQFLKAPNAKLRRPWEFDIIGP